MPETNHIAEKIRHLREARGLNVEDLAELSQSSPRFIAQLEAGEFVPSLAPLLKVARALGVHLGTFLDDHPQQGPVITKQGHSAEVMHFSGLRPALGASTLDFHPLAPDKKDRHMEPFIVDVHPTVAEDCTLSSHEGEEFMYVLSGAIEVIYGKETYTLDAGDSIYYDSIVPHQVQAGKDAEARILAVVYTPF